jgi:Tetracyclin repressor-like, C-terminal domain
VAQTMQTFDHLVVTVQRCIDSGRFEPADALDVALALHGLVHGLASLELRGSLGAGADADRRWGAALDASVRGYRRVDAG